MANLRDRGDVADVEATLSRLRGVASVRLLRDERGEIQEVHVLADDARHPKHISRDIESALFSEFGIRIDHRKISIAQTRAAEESLHADWRLRFLSIDFTIDRASARARVSVARGDDVYVGVASAGASGSFNQEALVARATLEAVSEFVRSTSVRDGVVVMELRDFSRVETSGRPFFAATVRVHGERGELDLIGSAIIRDDPWRAAACAALDAVNRRLASLCS